MRRARSRAAGDATETGDCRDTGAAETARGRSGGQHRRGLARAEASDYPERKRVTRPPPHYPGGRPGRRGRALLFLGYLRVSWTVAATSDGAAQALQARDMLAGNWLLHGWTVSDVSFYTTELPEYVLVELARPFGAGVIHVAAAVTYTLLVLAPSRSRGDAPTVLRAWSEACSPPGSCWRRSSGTGRSSCCSRRITSGRRCRCCSAGCCLTSRVVVSRGADPAGAPLVGARRLVPAARLGPVRGPGRARDGGPATGRRVRRSRDTPTTGPCPRGSGIVGRTGVLPTIHYLGKSRPLVRGRAWPGGRGLGRGGLGGGAGARRRRGVRAHPLPFTLAPLRSCGRTPG